MAWWNLGPDDGDDMIGDPAVDRLARALTAHAQACDDRGAPRPSLGDLLAAIADVLHRKAAVWCGTEDAARFATLEARASRGVEAMTVRASATPDPEIATRLIEAFEDISLQYEDAFDRQPRRHELLGVVAFVLGARVDTYLSEPGDLLVSDVVAG